jgi:hypothetical protein
MMIGDAQAAMRQAYVHGGPGAIVSSLVWFAAALALSRTDHATAFAVLFIGGMLIFPVSALIEKVVFHRSASSAGNPLGLLPLESTIAMIGCLLAAWLLLRNNSEFVFPVAAIAVGTHYLPFKTTYGDRTYWALGAVLTVIGCAGIFVVRGQTMAVILAVAAAELVFGILLTRAGVKAATAT